MFYRLIRLLCVSSVIAFAGCAATVSREGPSQAPITVSAAASKTLLVEVKAAPGMVSVGHWMELQADWREGIAIAASRAGRHVQWPGNEAAYGTEPAVLLVVKVRNYRYQTPGARLGMGILAGDAYLNVEVDFFEMPAKMPLGSRVYVTSTRAIEGILSATTRQQIIAMSNEVIADIKP